MSSRPVVSGGYTAAETETFAAAARALGVAADALAVCTARVQGVREVLGARLAGGGLALGAGLGLGLGAPGSAGSPLAPPGLAGPLLDPAARAAFSTALADTWQVVAALAPLAGRLDALRVAVLRAGHLYDESDSVAQQALRVVRGEVALGFAAAGRLGPGLVRVLQPAVAPVVTPVGDALTREAEERLPHWTGAGTMWEGFGPLAPWAVRGVATALTVEETGVRLATLDAGGAVAAVRGPMVERQTGTVAHALGRLADVVAGDHLDVHEVTTAADGTPLPAMPTPRTAEDLVAGVRSARAPGDGSVAVQRIGQGARARYVVTIPGTEKWAPLGSTDFSDPLDFVSDTQLMAGAENPVLDEVAVAMDTAGIPPDAPVVVVGHSLGGIAAARIAADPAFRSRYRIAAVVTAGSPVGRIDIPSSTLALHVENTKEGVSGLDAAPNPATPTRVTVRAPVDDDVVAASARDGNKGPHDTVTHDGVLAEARAEGDPALDRMLARIDGLLAGDGGDEPTQTWYVQGRRTDATSDPVPDAVSDAVADPVSDATSDAMADGTADPAVSSSGRPG